MIRRRTTTVLFSAILAGGMLLGTGATPVFAAKTYSNCKALNRVWHHGVGKPHANDHVSSGYPVTNFHRSRALYNANSGKDRDHDGVACERH